MMTNDELNTALYQRMFAEQEQFKSWLLTQTPEEMLKHCYEYTCREDILLSVEYKTDSLSGIMRSTVTEFQPISAKPLSGEF